MPSQKEVVMNNMRKYQRTQLKAWYRSVPGAVKGYYLRDHLTKNWDGRLQDADTYKVREYLQKPTKFLVCVGSSGTGKTAMAVSCIAHFIGTGKANNGMFYSATQFAHDLSFGSDTNNVQRALQANFLLLDDVGAMMGSGGMTDVRRTGMWNLINDRWSGTNKYTIITSNMPINGNGEVDGLRQFFGLTAWDRIIDDVTLVHFFGNSFRGKNRASYQG